MEQDPLAEAGASIEQSSYAEHPVDDAVGFAQSLLSESSVLGGQVTATLNSRAGRGATIGCEDLYFRHDLTLPCVYSPKTSSAPSPPGSRQKTCPTSRRTGFLRLHRLREASPSTLLTSRTSSRLYIVQPLTPPKLPPT